MDYQLQYVRFLSYWHEYRNTQKQLVEARKAKDAETTMLCLTRINEMIKDMDEMAASSLNAMTVEQEEAKGSPLTVVAGGYDEA